MKLAKSELRELIRECLREELYKGRFTEAADRKSITRNEIKNISVPASEFAVMTDLDNDASFCSYDEHYDEVWTENFLDELNSDNVFSAFGEAALHAIWCAKRDYDHEFFVVSINGDVYNPEASISPKINGYNWFSKYDNTTDTWSQSIKIRG
jgi:hypothetical protein